MQAIKQTSLDDVEQDLLRLPAANTAIEATAAAVLLHFRIVSFRGRILIKSRRSPGEYSLMDRVGFEQAVYPLIGGMTRSRISDTYAYLCNTAEDLTGNGHFILFGADTGRQTVWDMRALSFRTDVPHDDCVWRSPYPLRKSASVRRVKSLPPMLGSNIIQSLAPLLMARKPDGVIWWTVDNTDSISAIINALHKLFPGILSGLSVKQLAGGRSNTPLLNNALGNITEDNSQINDSELYKNLARHQDFNVHKYHSQSGITIRGNVHHVFLAKSVPVFSTGSLSADKLTHVLTLPPSNKSTSYPLTDDQLVNLLSEMCRYATQIAQQGYRYEWQGAEP